MQQAPLESSARPKTSEPWTLPANVATAASAVVATIALLFGVHQFNETMRAQRDSIFLQQRALESDRSSKAAELFGKFLEVAYTRPGQMTKEEAAQFRLERDNKALILLNAMYSVSKGDEEWQQLVQWSLLRYERLAKDRQVICLSLTSEFQSMLEKRLSESNPQICKDVSYGE